MLGVYLLSFSPSFLFVEFDPLPLVDQVMLAPPNSEPVIGTMAEDSNLIDCDHYVMIALVRTSAIMSNGPFILREGCALV
ncbi:cellulose synthase-like protein D5 [Canna indica]|uniref:Cellulose synthase-like protein D5 n=1 Tax=Canna indica TaxID=4628 RepID=A0AAQ3JKH9_9LILI|nr:cellulose synthase-like protein D5 [Canna indica]